MTLLAPRTPVITPEDLLTMPDAVSYELVDGTLVERNMGMESSRIGMKIGTSIGMFLQDHPLGLLFGSDASYQCFPDSPGKVRKPDVSFVRFGRLPDDRAPQGHCPIPPDMAIEVTSPGDLYSEVEEKDREYLAAGVPLVWVVHPPTRSVRVRRASSSPKGTVSDFPDGSVITGEDTLPGFSSPVSAFFE